MLVDFVASNFLSIGQEVKLSMVAGVPAAKRYGATFHTGNSLAPDILVAATIFGANSSGKTTIIKALKSFQDFVVRSVSMPKDGKLPHHFNKLIQRGAETPTEMEMSFTHDGELYQYGFSFDEQRIRGEWLYSRTSKKASRTRAMFTREYDEKSDGYHWYINELLIPGEREAWRNSTRQNALFLTTAVELNSEALTKPYNWIANSLHVIGANERLSSDFTARAINKNIEGIEKAEILDFMKSLDFSIDDFRVETTDYTIPENARKYLNPKILSEIEENSKNAVNYDVFAVHKVGGRTVELGLDEESDGTRAIFGLAGPIFDVLRNGETLVVDELNNSLHPLALQGLLNAFQSPSLNKKGAQLLFSSHETSMLSEVFLHMDQIWFVDRSDGAETSVYSLSEFDVRDLTGFQKAYLSGKFGAVPVVRRPNEISETDFREDVAR